MARKSYSARKREKLDYRAEYFKHNPGLFGKIWICAYCKKPLFGKHNVQVDHIMPLNNPLGRNKGYNLVAACWKCNNAKSDKVDWRVPVGYVSKIGDSMLFGAQWAATGIFVGITTIIWYVVSLPLKIIFAPLKSDSMIFRILYAAVLLFIAAHFFGLI